MYIRGVAKDLFLIAHRVMLRWKTPFSACLGAPSGSGKSTWMLEFLKHLPDLVDSPIKHIVWCFGEESAIPSQVENNPAIRTYRGVPSEESGLFLPDTLLILDDLMHSCYNETVSLLFTQKCHHLRVSCFLISQNIFHQSKHSRDISLSTQYFILLKNIRDKGQFQHLARQIYPENPKALCAAVSDAWTRPFSYIVLDLHPSSDDSCRFRSQIWPSDPYTVIYANPKSIEKLNNSEFAELTTGKKIIELPKVI